MAKDFRPVAAWAGGNRPWTYAAAAPPPRA